MWRRAMEGHAVCNHVPVAAANRVGEEDGLTFYGSSFLVDHRGRALAEADRDSTATVMASVDLERGPGRPGRLGAVPGPPAGPLRRAVPAPGLTGPGLTGRGLTD
jgi:hypothetical protein